VGTGFHRYVTSSNIGPAGIIDLWSPGPPEVQLAERVAPPPEAFDDRAVASIFTALAADRTGASEVTVEALGRWRGRATVLAGRVTPVQASW